MCTEAKQLQICSTTFWKRCTETVCSAVINSTYCNDTLEWRMSLINRQFLQNTRLSRVFSRPSLDPQSVLLSFLRKLKSCRVSIMPQMCEICQLFASWFVLHAHAFMIKPLITIIMWFWLTLYHHHHHHHYHHHQQQQQQQLSCDRASWQIFL